jgi:hypothetical protein
MIVLNCAYQNTSSPILQWETHPEKSQKLEGQGFGAEIGSAAVHGDRDSRVSAVFLTISRTPLC